MKQKRKNELLKQQIIACEEPDDSSDENDELKQVRKYIREDLFHEHNQEVLSRFTFLNGVEQVLQNRDKVARC